MKVSGSLGGMLTYLLLIFMIGSIYPAFSQTDGGKYTAIKIESEDLEQSDRFGFSVDIDGDYAVVGAYGESANTGAAYVFKNEEGVWTQKAKLTISDGESYDYLGYAVAISGNTVIASARGRTAAIIFEKTGDEWTDMTETAVLTPFSIEYNHYFSDNVDICGDYVIIGDWGHSDAYIYEKPAGGWVDMTETLFLDPPGYTAFFGYGLGINDEYAVVGAYYGYVDGMPQSGLAFVYRREADTWVMYDTLVPSNGENGDRFGGSVDIDQDRIIVGCFDNREAYIYHLQDGDWVEEDTLFASVYFGNDVAIRGDTAIVSNYLYNGNEDDSGGIWVYVRNGSEWEQVNLLYPGEPQEDAYLGKSMALTEDHLLAGAYGTNGDSSLAGQAYVYRDYIIPNIIDESGEMAVKTFKLHQNYPNPFNPVTHIDFYLGRSGHVGLTIYNMMGEKVKTLVDKKLNAGPQSITWDGTNNLGQKVSTGIYFYRLKSEEGQLHKKMILIK